MSQCEDAVAILAKQAGKIPGRLQGPGSGGKCMDTSWGQVPMGCSAQHGKPPHYKRGTKPAGYGPGCIHPIYQLVCVSDPGILHIGYHFVFPRKNI